MTIKKNFYNPDSRIFVFGEPVGETLTDSKSAVALMKDCLSIDMMDVIDASMMSQNKLRHVRQILEANPTLSDIENLRYYSALDAYTHAVGGLAPVVFHPSLAKYKQPYSEAQNITSLIAETETPIIFINGGSNELMEYGYADPISIAALAINEQIFGSFFKKGQERLNFTRSVLTNPLLYKSITDEKGKIIDYLFAINSKVKIILTGTYSLGIFKKVPEQFAIFKDAIDQLNASTKELAKIKNCNFLDLTVLENCCTVAGISPYTNRKGRELQKGMMIDAAINAFANSERIQTSPSIQPGNGGLKQMIAGAEEYKRNLIQGQIPFLDPNSSISELRSNTAVEEAIRDLKVYEKAYQKTV